MRLFNSIMAVLAVVVSFMILPTGASGYNVTALTTTTGNPHANSTIDFVVLDPAKYSNNSNTTCHGSWNPTAGPPTSWQLCANTTFAWMFGDFDGNNAVGAYKNGSTFGLSIQHHYVDPALGPPPYDILRTFGRAQVNETVVDCSTANASTTCREKDGEDFVVPVVAITG